MSDPWAFGWTQVLTLLGFTITVGIAISGFRTFGRWKQEKLEERKIELAFEILALAYESKFVFDAIRSPASFGYEYEDMEKRPGESQAEWDARGPYYAILKRIGAHKDFFERIFKIQPRCMAVFGEKAEEIFLLLHKSRREIEVSAQMLGWREGFNPEQQEQMRRDIWDHGDLENDKVGVKLLRFRKSIEGLCGPIVDREYGKSDEDSPLGMLSIKGLRKRRKQLKRVE
jgi:hypothetical protein